MDATLVSVLDISTELLSIPIYARALDGRSIGRGTHRTIPIHLRVSRNHHGFNPGLESVLPLTLP
jgi:hypothetical protein